ncbi:MAG TPA: hypothetical protein VHB30_14280 [Solirubrobacteraceae bacterium]|jgi:hypothetical protein|nr:hypothetical protein [Solirubrobacteraceae bacterium]
MPEFGFAFDDEDVDRHAALIGLLAQWLPLPAAFLDEYSYELVIVAPDAVAATERAHHIVWAVTIGTDLYIEPEGRHWSMAPPAGQQRDAPVGRRFRRAVLGERRSASRRRRQGHDDRVEGRVRG